jgi:hypothetical protein
MAKKKTETKKVNSNFENVSSKAKLKIQEHKDAVIAREIAVAKFAKLGITEADLKAMGL